MPIKFLFAPYFGSVQSMTPEMPLAKPLLKPVAPLNTLVSDVDEFIATSALAKFHPLTLWLNLVAPLNILPMVVAEDMSHESGLVPGLDDTYVSPLLKFVAPLNMFEKLLPLAVFQLLKSWLKAALSWNIEEKDDPLAVFQEESG